MGSHVVWGDAGEFWYQTTDTGQAANYESKINTRTIGIF